MRLNWPVEITAHLSGKRDKYFFLKHDKSHQSMNHTANEGSDTHSASQDFTVVTSHFTVTLAVTMSPTPQYASALLP